MAYFKKSEVRSNLTPNQVRQEYPEQVRSISEYGAGGLENSNSGAASAGIRSASNTSFGGGGAGGGPGSGGTLTSPQQPNHMQFYPNPSAGGQGAGYGDDSPSMMFGSEGTRTNSQYDWWSADSPSVQTGNWKDQQNPNSFTTSSSGGHQGGGGGGRVGLPTNRSSTSGNNEGANRSNSSGQQQQQVVGGMAGNGRVSGSNSAKFKMPKMNPLFDPSTDDEDPFSNLPPPPPPPGPPPPPLRDGDDAMGDPLASASPGEDPFAGIDDHQPPTSSSPNFGTYEHAGDDPGGNPTGDVAATGGGAGDEESWEGWYQADDGYWYKKPDEDLNYDPYTQETTTPQHDDEDDDDGEFLESVLGDSIAGAGSDYQGSPKNPLRGGGGSGGIYGGGSESDAASAATPVGGKSNSNNKSQSPPNDDAAMPKLGEKQTSTTSTTPSTKPPISPASPPASLSIKQNSSNLGGGAGTGGTSSKTPTSLAGTPSTVPPGTANASFLSPHSPHGMNGSMVSNSSDAGSPRMRPPLRQGSNSSTGGVDQKIRFRKIKELGKGAFGEVFLAMNILTGALMAVKQIRLDDQTAGSKLVRDVEREINIMATLPEHPNVVRYFGSQQGNKCQYIMMEVVSGGSVEGLLRATKRRFHEATIQQYAFMVLLGLQHLHQHNIVHQDIKGANVLIDNAGLAKIADFGCCKDLGQMHMNSSKTAGSPLFMSPEVCRGAPADTRSDIWSFGCFLLEMAKDDRRPWSGFGKDMSLFAIIYAISSATEPPEIPSYLSPVCQDFIARCLCIDPAARATTDELLSHQFFAEDSIFDMDVLEQMHSEVEFTPDHSPQRGGTGAAGGAGQGAGGAVFSKSHDSLSDVRQDSATFVRSTPMNLPNTKDSASPLLESNNNNSNHHGKKSIGGGGRGGGGAPEEESQQLYQFSLGSAKSTYNDTYTPVGLRSLNPSGSAIKRQVPGVGIPQQASASTSGGDATSSGGLGGGMVVSNGSGVLNVPRDSSIHDDNIPTVKPRGEGPIPYNAANGVDQGPLIYHFQGGGAVKGGGGGGSSATTAPQQQPSVGGGGAGGGPTNLGNSASSSSRPSPNNQLALVEYVSNSAHKRQKGRGGGKGSKNGGVLDALVNKFKCIGQ